MRNSCIDWRITRKHSVETQHWRGRETDEKVSSLENRLARERSSLISDLVKLFIDTDITVFTFDKTVRSSNRNLRKPVGLNVRGSNVIIAGHCGNRDTTMDRGYRLINFILASRVIALKKIFLWGTARVSRIIEIQKDLQIQPVHFYNFQIETKLFAQSNDKMLTLTGSLRRFLFKSLSTLERWKPVIQTFYEKALYKTFPANFH